MVVDLADMDTERIIISNLRTSIGDLIIGSFNDELVMCDWRYRRMRGAIDGRLKKGLIAEYIEGSTPVIERAILQVKEYLNGERRTFDLPLRLVGTDFQQKVWRSLQVIPYGETRSYAELTKEISDPGAVRAVAAANGANALSIIVPCHRVIGSTGELVGYAGGLRAKKSLLELEGAMPHMIDLFSTLAEN